MNKLSRLMTELLNHILHPEIKELYDYASKKNSENQKKALRMSRNQQQRSDFKNKMDDELYQRLQHMVDSMNLDWGEVKEYHDMADQKNLQKRRYYAFQQDTVLRYDIGGMKNFNNKIQEGLLKIILDQILKMPLSQFLENENAREHINKASIKTLRQIYPDRLANLLNELKQSEGQTPQHYGGFKPIHLTTHKIRTALQIPFLRQLQNGEDRYGYGI